MQPIVQQPQLLTIRQVSARTTLSKNTIYRLIRAGKFPQPIKIAPRRVAWKDTDIDALIAGGAHGTVPAGEQA